MTSSWSLLHQLDPSPHPQTSLSKKKNQTTLTSASKILKTLGKNFFLSVNTFISFPNQQWMTLDPPNQDHQPNLPKKHLEPPKLTKPPKPPLSQGTQETIIALTHLAVVLPVSIQSSPNTFSKSVITLVIQTQMQQKVPLETTTWISTLHKVVCLVAIIMFHFVLYNYDCFCFCFCQSHALIIKVSLSICNH